MSSSQKKSLYPTMKRVIQLSLVFGFVVVVVVSFSFYFSRPRRTLFRLGWPELASPEREQLKIEAKIDSSLPFKELSS